ncbi:SEC-C metal-binding domain-containing protein, partial [Bacteroides fragilis]
MCLFYRSRRTKEIPLNDKDMKEKRMVSVLIPKDGFTGLIAQKTGRNKVCPCGSGKKAKK